MASEKSSNVCPHWNWMRMTMMMKKMMKKMMMMTFLLFFTISIFVNVINSIIFLTYIGFLDYPLEQKKNIFNCYTIFPEFSNPQNRICYTYNKKSTRLFGYFFYYIPNILCFRVFGISKKKFNRL